MGWWKDWGRYAAVGVSVVAGVAVGVASGGTLAPLAAAGVGSLVAGAGIGATAAVDSMISDDKKISIQEEQLQDNIKADAIGFITNDELNLDSYLKDIDLYLTKIDEQNLIIDRNLQNIDVNNEWLAMYQGMLNGEDNLLSQERNLLDAQIAQAVTDKDIADQFLLMQQNAADAYLQSSQLEKDVLTAQIAQATASKGLAEQVLVQQRNSAEAYLQSSQLEKDNASRQGFMSYAEMMKQKSLANVVAGATGGVRSAFSANAINQQNEIRRYIGDDLKFNVGGDGAGAGTFAREFSVLKTAIDNQILANNISIQAAQNDIARVSDDIDAATKRYGVLETEIENQIMANNIAIQNAQSDVDKAAYNIDAATLNLNSQLDAWDTNRSALEQDNADKQAAIDKDRESIERWTSLVDGFQEEAIKKLQSWQKSAVDAGKTQDEIDSMVEDTKRRFKDLGYEI